LCYKQEIKLFKIGTIRIGFGVDVGTILGIYFFGPAGLNLTNVTTQSEFALIIEGVVAQVQSEDYSAINFGDFNFEKMMAAAMDVDQDGTVQDAISLLTSQQYYQFG